MKVIVCQCPCGTCAMSRSPRCHHPWLRVMFVLVQVSSMKTSRFGVKLGCRRCHHRRLRATSGRFCSLARTLFFEADVLPFEKPPERVTRYDDVTLLDQFGPQGVQGQIRLLAQTFKQPIAVRFQKIGALAAHHLGRRAARLSLALCPFHDRGGDDVGEFGNVPAAHAVRHQGYHTLTQVERIGSSHACWPPPPACSLNQNAPDSGIPPDSIKVGSALAWGWPPVG